MLRRASFTPASFAPAQLAAAGFGGVMQLAYLRVFVEGDSRAETLINQALYAQSRPRDIGVATWACAYLQGAARIVLSNQVGGTSSTQIADRVEAALQTLDGKIDEMWIPEMGINNMHSAAAASFDQEILRADTLRVISAAATAGVRVRIGTIRPVRETFAGYTPLLIERIQAHRQWLLSLAFSHVTVIDTWGGGDVSGIEGGPNGDGIHINQSGAQSWGRQLALAVATNYTLIPQLHDPLLYTGSEQLISNPDFSGIGGTNSSGLTGPVPTGFRLVKTGAGMLTGTSQIIPEADDRGPIWRITVTNTTAAAQLIWRFNAMQQLVEEGDILEGWCGVAYSGGNNVLSVNPNIFVNNVLQASACERVSTENLTVDQFPQASIAQMQSRIGRTSALSGATTLCEMGGGVSFAGAGGTITIDLWRPRCCKVSDISEV